MSEIRSGDRVRLKHTSPVLAFRSMYGTVKTLDGKTGYWVVELDEPADYADGDGDTRHLTEIREHAENMRKVSRP